MKPAVLRRTLAKEMTATKIGRDPLHGSLAASERSPEIPPELDAYGWLVASWELDVLHYWAVDVSGRDLKGEVHAGWVLEGRAVQDVWIMPRRSDRGGQLDKKFNMYGTTLRLWDATIQGWRITWRNPAGDHHEPEWRTTPYDAPSTDEHHDAPAATEPEWRSSPFDAPPSNPAITPPPATASEEPEWRSAVRCADIEPGDHNTTR